MSNSNARRQANINAKKFDQLMKDIEKDVAKRTKNAKNLDIWTNKLGSYVNTNPFSIGGIKHAEIVTLLENIMSQAKFKGLARGGTAELVKGVISENTMHYVTRMGDDMKNNLRRIAVESYNEKLAPQQIAKKLQEEVQGLSKTRAKAIARTETMRANNLSNYVNAKLNMGAKSYKVLSASDCCDKCDQLYKNGGVWFDIEDTDNLPPLHPNCRCVASYSTKTVAENNGITLSNDNLDKTTQEIKSFQKDTGDLDHEVLTVFDKNGNKILNMYKGEENKVFLPKDIAKTAKNEGFSLSIHNHPSQVPIPSRGDIINFIRTKTQVGVATAKNNYSITTIKNHELATKEIDKIAVRYGVFNNRIKNEFVKSNPSIIKRIENKYPNDVSKQNIEKSKEFEKYAQKNTDKIIKELNNNLNKYDINIILK